MRKSRQAESVRREEPSWDSAIADAKRRLEATRRLGHRLERAIVTFQARKADGTPFPGNTAK
jgi:hypothetical protein